MTYSYARFKAGPPRRIMAALGPAFLEALDTTRSYPDFREAIVRLNSDKPGCVRAARRYANVCSPGERELLKGILLLTDFAHVADEIAASEAYGDMTRCAGPFREAFAACVANAGRWVRPVEVAVEQYGRWNQYAAGRGRHDGFHCPLLKKSFNF